MKIVSKQKYLELIEKIINNLFKRFTFVVHKT